MTCCCLCYPTGAPSRQRREGAGLGAGRGEGGRGMLLGWGREYLISAPLRCAGQVGVSCEFLEGNNAVEGGMGGRCSTI